MKKALRFKVKIKGLEDKIWRDILVDKSFMLSDLIYFILSSYDLYYKQFFNVTIGDKHYDSVNTIYDEDNYLSVMPLKLKDINFKDQKEIFLLYNLKCKTEFIIEYIEETTTKGNLPKVIDGEGKSAIEEVSGEELKSIVEETDKLGYSTYNVTTIIDDEEIEENFDYKDFDLESNNMLSYINYQSLKDDYESLILQDILRVIKENEIVFYKTDTKQIVKPFDYLKEYIPKNFDKLSSEERNKLNIPSYEDLNIYALPSYKELCHKKIMTLYVKGNVVEKNERQDLFYALRNYDYMFKFYDVLRKHGLFYDYLYYSDDYYQEKINEWKEENGI